MFSWRFWNGLGTVLRGVWRTSEDTFGRPGASSGGNWGYGAGLAAQELPGDAPRAPHGPEMVAPRTPNGPEMVRKSTPGDAPRARNRLEMARNASEINATLTQC